MGAERRKGAGGNLYIYIKKKKHNLIVNVTIFVLEPTAKFMHANVQKNWISLINNDKNKTYSLPKILNW